MESQYGRRCAARRPKFVQRSRDEVRERFASDFSFTPRHVEDRGLARWVRCGRRRRWRGRSPVGQWLGPRLELGLEAGYLVGNGRVFQDDVVEFRVQGVKAERLPEQAT